MPRKVWEAVETKVGKIRVGKTKRRRKKRGGRKEARRERAEERKREKKKEKTKSGRIGDLGRRRSSKVGRRGKETGSRKVL